LDTLADTTFSCVGDMTETCRRHVADTTQNVAVWALGKKTTRRHPTYGAKLFTKSIGLTNMNCQRYGIVPACAEVCRTNLCSLDLLPQDQAKLEHSYEGAFV